MNTKKIADELLDPNFDAFIAEQILNSRLETIKGPCFSIVCKNSTIDVWKNKENFDVVKSDILKTSEKDFIKTINKAQLIEEIIKIVNSFLD